MKKKIALILDSMDKIFPLDGKIHGGANRVGKYLIEYFSSLENIELDIICGVSNISKLEGISNIISFDFCPFSDMDKFFQNAKAVIEKNNYDKVITNDLFSPFGDIIVHSHTMMYKSKNCKNLIEKCVLSITKKKKINKFKKLFKDKNRKIFTVSNRLRQDYIDNLGFDEKNVICVYPGVEQKETKNFSHHTPFTFGIVAGNAINKGGYLFLLAAFLMKLNKIEFQGKMIITKSKKGNPISSFLKFLKLNDVIEILPEQASMEDFYNQIDCLVVPSVNEAFGLVVTEAASYSKPSIVSQTAGSAEILKEGINGFIFNRTSCLIKSVINLYRKMKEVSLLQKDELTNISSNAYNLSKQFIWNEYSKSIADYLI